METEGKYETGGSSFEGERHELKEKARSTADRARTQVRSMADSGLSELAAQIAGIGRALRGAGDRLKEEEHGGQASQYTELLADRAERVSRFLDEHDAGEIFGEVENAARKNPALFIGGCLAAGLVLGRFLKASPGPSEGEGPERMPLGVGGPEREEQPPGYAATPGYGGTPGYEPTPEVEGRSGVEGGPGIERGSDGERSARGEEGRSEGERERTPAPETPVVTTTEVIEVTTTGPGYVQPITGTKRDDESGER